ncbi:hypothetical protein SAMN05446635_6770 [Burkholderia sp. OK233]|nr:hypothetical protein SAMN05446635_6770 [Burkholderia sp. OK233]
MLSAYPTGGARKLRRVSVGLAAGVAWSVCSAAAQDVTDPNQAVPDISAFSFNLGGYVRTWASMNLQNHPETGGGAGQLSMLRGSVDLNADATTGPIQWKAVVRTDREVMTSYQRDLQTLNRTNSPGGPGSSLLGQYNQTELREFYADFSVTPNIRFRIGKQEVAWGETDFFHPTDLINGYDFRWRSFLERDNDELRKPLFLINTNIEVPKLAGNLQLILRPGIDAARDIGNSYDLSGGRWAEQPNHGFDFLAPGNLNMNYHQSGANVNDATGGLRWTGRAGEFDYGLSYLNTFNPTPVVNSSFAPWRQAPTGKLGDFIYPKINVFGASTSTEIPAIDSVVAGEFAYQLGVPYNVGSNFLGGALPGFGGIKTKNVIVTSLRLDKQLRLMDLLGTSEASFASIQLFDTWIQNYHSSDDLVYGAGYGKPARKHTTTLTGFITLNYMHSRLNPQLAGGMDITNGDAFVIPSVEYRVGNHWRFLAEADLFFLRHQKYPGQIEQATAPLGAAFAHSDQFMVRATYQF